MLLIGVHGTSVAHMTAVMVARRSSAKKAAVVEDMVVAEVEAVEEEEDVEEDLVAEDAEVDVEVDVAVADTEVTEDTVDETAARDLVVMRERTGDMTIVREEDPGHVHTDVDPDAHQCREVQMRNVTMVMTAEMIVAMTAGATVEMTVHRGMTAHHGMTVHQEKTDHLETTDVAVTVETAAMTVLAMISGM